MANANPPTHADWAWPALIQSLQRDISRLNELADEARRDASAAREQHRRELDALIEQLRQVKDALQPIIDERSELRKLAQQTRWRWIERLGWVAMGGIALALWEFVKHNLRND